VAVSPRRYEVLATPGFGDQASNSSGQKLYLWALRETLGGVSGGHSLLMILRAIALHCQEEVGCSHKSGYAHSLGCDFASAKSNSTETSRNPN